MTPDRSAPALRTVPTVPIPGQKPGTSGLRARTVEAMQPGWIENLAQSILDVIAPGIGSSLVLGGDGRFFNERAIQVLLKMAAANGVAHVAVARNGLLSTPSASAEVRHRRADGALILSASHNPGGEDGDFGLKVNIANGGPAPEPVTDAIHRRTLDLAAYRMLDAPDIDLASVGNTGLGPMRVEVFDPVPRYAALMRSLFDFDAIRALFRSGFRMRFDAMHAVTGPYARALLEDELGAGPGTVVNATPRPDFGGRHPDPNPVHAAGLVAELFADGAPDFAAASDGDGDRNMILGRGICVGPSDSLAILAANLHLAPGYAEGPVGIARSMPTSRAADRVARALGIPCFETPTGWKYFGTLLDAGRVTICGEESAGTGSDHVREKDGLWAVLLWLNILAVRRRSVAGLLDEHWARFGRDYYSRHDYEGVDPAAADAVIETLRRRLPDLPGRTIEGLTVSHADEFAYLDPVDGSTSERQGIRVNFGNEARAVFRLSGTGTSGATLRVYLERFEAANPYRFDNPQAALARVIRASDRISDLTGLLGRAGPDMRG